jgi:hypothetical protein
MTMDDLARSNSLVVLVGQINAAHEAAAAALKSSVIHAMQAGDMLLEAKEQVGHGEWLPWLKANFPFSDRTARLYMQLARKRVNVEAKMATVADLSLREAVDEITEREPETYLASGGHVRVGVLETDRGFEEVWIAPSAFFPGFFFITHVLTPPAGHTVVTGSNRPVHAEGVGVFVEAMLGKLDVPPVLKWREAISHPWLKNHLLHDDTNSFAESISFEDCVDIATGRRAPSSDNPDFYKKQLSHVDEDASRMPLSELVFGLARTTTP